MRIPQGIKWTEPTKGLLCPLNSQVETLYYFLIERLRFLSIALTSSSLNLYLHVIFITQMHYIIPAC